MIESYPHQYADGPSSLEAVLIDPDTNGELLASVEIDNVFGRAIDTYVVL